ncbi:MAG: hypothetical protein IT353_00330 [Gemmatimonadaceae bacterium]|nr:hypothetical protein [Gemmatimonadaceae bacterium]
MSFVNFLPSRAVCARRRMSAAVGASLLAPSLLLAQVGHRPDKSPFEDVKLGQNVSLSIGRLSTGLDLAGVAPKSAVYGQLMYEAAVGGPASLYARYTIAPTERTLLAPAAPVATRKTGTLSTTMHLFDGGLDLALTGKKSWHHLIPSVVAGVGIATDFAAVDSGGYQFGSKFALTYGLAARYVPKSGVRFRIDVMNAMWQYDYPDRYFVKATDNTSVLTNSSDRSIWRGNWGVSAGVSIPVFK